MSQFGQELSPNDAPALPLWIDGHAYLLMAEQFHTVINAQGQALRRVPLYGDDAVAIAAGSTEQALGGWRGMTGEQREDCFRKLHELLARYSTHFGKLLAEETGFSQELAAAELEQALAGISGRANSWSATGGVAAVASDSLAPLAAPLTWAVEALAAGWGVVLKPSTKAPSALFALAELCSRAGFPAGLVNCVHGDEQVMRALCSRRPVAALAFVGGPELSRRIASLAGEGGVPCVAGSPDEALQEQWRHLLGSAA